MNEYEAQDVKQALGDLQNSALSKIQDIETNVKNLSDDMADVLQRGTKMPDSGHKARNRPISEALSKADGLQRVRQGAKNSDPIDLGISIKTLTSLQGSTGSPQEGIDVLPAREPGLFGYAMRPLTLLDVMPIRAIASNQLTFTRMDSYSNAADTQSGEGTTKAEQTITPTLISSPIETIAVWHDASKQVLEDEPGLESTISMLLTHGVREKAEQQIVNGAGASFEMSGLITDGTTFVPTKTAKADRIGECQAGMANTGYFPEVVLLNPIDWFEIRAERATDGEYVGPGWASASPPSVYGIAAVASAAVPSGTAIVIDTRFVSLLDREQATVEMSRETGSNFKQNLVTILAELRLGLAIYDTAAVQVIDLNATV